MPQNRRFFGFKSNGEIDKTRIFSDIEPTPVYARIRVVINNAICKIYTGEISDSKATSVPGVNTFFCQKIRVNRNYAFVFSLF